MVRFFVLDMIFYIPRPTFETGSLKIRLPVDTILDCWVAYAVKNLTNKPSMPRASGSIMLLQEDSKILIGSMADLFTFAA